MRFVPTCLGTGLLVVLAGITAPPAAAQACLGSPAEPGAFTLGAGAVVSNGEPGGFLKGRANLASPLAFSSRLGIEGREGGTNAFVAAGTLALEASFRGFDMCPTAGFTHVVWKDRSEEEDVSLSELRFPVGLAIGARSDVGESAALLPWLHGGILPSRIRRSVPGTGSEMVSSMDTEVAAFVGGGAAVLFGRAFLRGGVSITTLDGSAAAFSLELGYMIERGI